MTLTFSEAVDVVADYGEVLERINAPPVQLQKHLFHPDTLLPHPKEKILEAIRVMMADPIKHHVTEARGNAFIVGVQHLPRFVPVETFGILSRLMERYEQWTEKDRAEFRRLFSDDYEKQVDQYLLYTGLAVPDNK